MKQLCAFFFPKETPITGQEGRISSCPIFTSALGNNKVALNLWKEKINCEFKITVRMRSHLASKCGAWLPFVYHRTNVIFGFF